MKIGIPRALFYYYHYPLWYSFFDFLGAEVIISPPTSKDIVDRGLSLAVDEACLPIKIFFGHVDYLKDKVDLLFVPRLVSIALKEFICPKFMGLPDMVRQNIKDLPPLIDTTIDLSKDSSKLHTTVKAIGSFCASDLERVTLAWQYALNSYQHFKKLTQQFILPEDAFEMIYNFQRPEPNYPSNKIKIGLLGHGYNLYDSYLNLQAIRKIKNLQADVITAENLDAQIIDFYAAKLPKKMFWTLGKKVLGSTLYWLDKQQVGGIIYLGAFGCGPDSLVGDIVLRYCHQHDFPVLSLTIDEHTGEAGLDTRLEAFVDLLEGRLVR